MIVKRTESHILKPSNSFYKLLREKCHIAKNIYNHGNYIIRQEFIKTGKWLHYAEVEKLMHDDLEYPDYWELGLANSSQQILRVLDKNWKSFFKAIKDWKKHPKKYTGRPKLPKYLKKDGHKEFVLTTNQVKLKDDGYIHFPKVLDGFKIKPKFIEKDFHKFNQAMIIPQNDRIIIELIYEIEVKETPKEHVNIGSIDLGIDNFVTFVDNLGNQPIIINGKGLKSKNKYYNKLVTHHKSIFDINGNKGYSHLLYSITNKRNNYINYFMHCASKYIVELCKSRNITCIVIGKNDGWKNECDLGKKINQTLVQIPYNSFISKLRYKCQNAGIELIEHEESYTSGTSFLDGELPIKKYYNIKRRIKRGLFKSSKGLINSDVNGACQIMKKVFANAFGICDIGCVDQPIRIDVC